jgi:hypothetical protein
MSNLELVLLAGGIVLGFPFLFGLMTFFFIWLSRKMGDRE